MGRTIVDQDLRRWEAYATTGPYGMVQSGKVAFRCTTDPGQRPRALAIDGDKSEAERRVVEGSEEDLLRMLEKAAAID